MNHARLVRHYDRRLNRKALAVLDEVLGRPDYNDFFEPVDVPVVDSRRDLWVDFNSVDEDGVVESLTEFGSGAPLLIGAHVIVGDDDGLRCPAVVVHNDGHFVRVRLIEDDPYAFLTPVDWDEDYDPEEVAESVARARKAVAENHPWMPCGLGSCAAEEGHEGTCDEASGWTDEQVERDVAFLRQHLDVREAIAKAYLIGEVAAARRDGCYIYADLIEETQFNPFGPEFSDRQQYEAA